MLKKLFILFLIPVFMLATSGLAYSAMLCQGKVADEGFMVKKCCEKKVNKDCCKFKTSLLKVKDSFQKTGFYFDSGRFLAVISEFSPVQIFSSPVIEKEKYFSFLSNAPPLSSVSRNILFCTYLI
jgi:hypothetical protein